MHRRGEDAALDLIVDRASTKTNLRDDIAKAKQPAGGGS
jgi:hypothetical protein